MGRKLPPSATLKETSTGFRLFVRTLVALSGGILLNQPGIARATDHVSDLPVKSSPVQLKQPCLPSEPLKCHPANERLGLVFK